MPERLPWAFRLEAGFAGACLAVAVVGLVLLPLTAAPVVRSLAVLSGAPGETGLSRDSALAAAEQVRRFVVDPDVPTLPASVDGRPAFDEQAVSHLDDVRDVVVPSLRLALILTLLAVTWAGVRARSPVGRRVVGLAMTAAGALLLASGAVATAAGLSDFDAFFSWFHGLFFAPGTWVFAADALLVQLFPIAFWTTAGALWAAGVLATAVVLVAAGRRLRLTHAQ